MNTTPLPMMTFYVAFSVHGTNRFITATKQVPREGHFVELFKLGTHGMSIAASRRGNFDEKNEIKMHWDALKTKKTGKPLRSPALIASRMRKLQKLGFTVNDKAFIDYHFRRSYVQTHALPR